MIVNFIIVVVIIFTSIFIQIRLLIQSEQRNLVKPLIKSENI